jgi:beta-ketoacyl-acyl-carrier-protein synthase II
MQRVVITGMGVICPLGLNVKDFWLNLSTGKSGVSQISRFDTSAYPVKVAAEVNGFDPTNYIDSKTLQRNPRAVHFAIPATKEAITQAELDISQEQSERIGVVGTSMIEYNYVGENWEKLKKYGPRRVDPLMFAKAGPTTLSLQLGMLLMAKGPNADVNSLCASGTDAIATASEYIRLDYADVMIAVASDASLSEMGIAALSILGALTKETDPDKASRPFDLNRNGFVYGEGCGVLVLESLEHARDREAPIFAEVAGIGRTFDAYDPTAPASESEATAMKLALQSAGVDPHEVDYINAHGTSTKLNDVSETKAIKRALGDIAYRVPISSFKSMFGHPITAAGAIESIGVVLTINNGIIPPTIHYETPDPECDLNYVPNVAQKAQLNVCLKNSFGLGGQNCCLVIKNSC